MPARPRRHLAGPPIALPPALDRVAEAWWRARPRTRAVLVVLAVTVWLVATGVRVASPEHGPPSDAWIAVADLPPGHVLGSGDLEQVRWPRGVLPDAVAVEPAGTLATTLPRGAVLTDRHLGDDGLAAALPDGTAAVPIPPEALPALPTGGRVDLLAHHLDGHPRLVATGAVVLRADETAVWLAVDRAAAPDVAAAALAGAIGVVLTAP